MTVNPVTPFTLPQGILNPFGLFIIVCQCSPFPWPFLYPQSRWTKPNLAVWHYMVVNPVTPFTLLQGILNPLCFVTPQRKVKLPVIIFSFLLCQTEIRCLVESWINVLELSLRPLEAWGSRALSIPCQIHQLINSLTPSPYYHRPQLPVRAQPFTTVNLDSYQFLSKIFLTSS